MVSWTLKFKSEPYTKMGEVLTFIWCIKLSKSWSYLLFDRDIDLKKTIKFSTCRRFEINNKDIKNSI